MKPSSNHVFPGIIIVIFPHALICNSSLLLGGFRGRGHLKSAEIYNIKEDTFRYISEMPYAVTAPCGVKSPNNQDIYLVGGYGAPTFISTMMVYDIEKAKFRKLPGEMKTPRTEAVCQAFEQTVVAASGKTTKWVWINSIDVYNIQGGTWKAGKALPGEKWWFFRHQGELLVLDGTLSLVQSYNQECDSWKAVLGEKKDGPDPEGSFYPRTVMMFHRKDLSNFC